MINPGCFAQVHNKLDSLDTSFYTYTNEYTCVTVRPTGENPNEKNSKQMSNKDPIIF